MERVSQDSEFYTFTVAEVEVPVFCSSWTADEQCSMLIMNLAPAKVEIWMTAGKRGSWTLSHTQAIHQEEVSLAARFDGR